MTVVPQSEIARSPAPTVADVLFTQPGITSSTFAPGASRPIIRGLDNFRVRIQENNVSSMDVSNLGEDHAVPIDPFAIDRIEVIRGPATLRFGTQATGGVVSIINNRIPEPDTPQGISTTVRAGFNSVDRGFDSGVISEARNGSFAFHGEYAQRAGSDYRIPGGTQANSSYRTESASVGASYIFNEGFVGFAVTHYNTLYHIPGLESAATNTRLDPNQTKVLSKGEYRLDGSLVDTVRFWFGASDYKHNELGTTDAGVDGVRATFKNREQEGRIEAQLVPFRTGFGVLTTAIGVQAGHQELGTSGEAGSLLAPSRTDRFAAYIFNELSITNNLRAQAAARIGTVSVKGSAATFPGLLPDGTEVMEQDRRRTFVPANVSLGLLRDLPFGIVASVTGQYTERAPEALELFAKGAHDSPGTFEIGDANLKKETATSIEVGLRRAKGAFRFDATGYYSHYQGFISKRLTGIRCGEDFDSCGVETDFRQVVYSQQNASFTGVDLSSQLDVAALAGGTIGVDGQYDFVRARFDDGTKVPRIPPHRLGGGVYWRDANWFARVGLLHAFAQNETAPEETSTPGYDLLRAEISYTQKFKDQWGPREVTIGVVGTNLLDDDVRNHVSFKKDEVLLAGRGVRFFTTVKF